MTGRHQEPLRPDAAAIAAGVAKAYQIAPDRVLERASGEAYKAAIYMLRRAANLPLAEVAKRAGVSPPRVSQIPSEIEKGRLAEPLKSLLRIY